MAYTLLIVEDPHQRDTRTPAERRAAYDSMVQFAEQLKARGLLLATQSLTSHAAARVQVHGGGQRGGALLRVMQPRDRAIRVFT